MISKIRFIGRVFIVYVCVLIPIILLSVVITQSSFRQIEDREEKIMQQVLQDIAGELDGWHQDFQSQVNVVATRKELSKMEIQNSRMKEIEAVELLQFAQLFSRLASDINIYYGDDKLYSAKGFSRVSVYFGQTLRCTETYTEKAEKVLSIPDFKTLYLKTNGTEDILLYHYPIASLGEQISSVQFLVSVEQLKQVLEHYIPDTPVLFGMKVGDETAYFQVSDGECRSLAQEDYVNLQTQQDYIMRKKLALTDIELELCFDPQVSWNQLRHFQFVNTGLLIAGVSLSFLLSLVLSGRRWRRFQSLTSTMSTKKDMKLTPKVITDEYDYMKLMLEQSLRENELVEQNAEGYRHGMLRQISVMLFHGILKRQEVIREMLSVCGLELAEAFYYLCGIQPIDSSFDISSLEHVFAERIYCEAVLQDRKVILFLEETTSLDQDGKLRVNGVESVTARLATEGIEVERVALSQIYDKLSLVNYAYLEVVSLLEEPLTLNEKVVLWDSHQLYADKCLTAIQSDLLEVYMQALENRNLQSAETALNSMHACELDSKDNWHQSNCYYLRYCIRQALIVAIRSDEMEQCAELVKRVMLIGFGNEMQFYQQMREILQTFCVDSNRSELLETAVEYVRSNYGRSDLSLEEVAEHVGRSRVQLSKLFKVQLGISYIDFLTKLRLHKAQELLANTDMPVKDILLEVGYLDKASFNRKFKTYFGMTPVEYRNEVKYQEKQEG